MRNQWAALYFGGVLFFALLARGCVGGAAVAGGASHLGGGDSETDPTLATLSHAVTAGRAYR